MSTNTRPARNANVKINYQEPSSRAKLRRPQSQTEICCVDKPEDHQDHHWHAPKLKKQKKEKVPKLKLSSTGSCEENEGGDTESCIVLQKNSAGVTNSLQTPPELQIVNRKKTKSQAPTRSVIPIISLPNHEEEKDATATATNQPLETNGDESTFEETEQAESEYEQKEDEECAILTDASELVLV